MFVFCAAFPAWAIDPSHAYPAGDFPELPVPERPPPGKKTLIPVNERQGKAVLYEEILNGAGTKAAGIVISLSRQKVYLVVGGETAIDSPIASGRKEGWTPKGRFRIMEKDPDHRSNRYGDLLDGDGKVIRRNVTCGTAGGIFRGASMKWFLRLNQEGVGMHAGILPGYPASHGCIRLPREVAERLYRIVPTGTPVLVTD
jgi:lipoprotein-anchoring transpeptidase ErfK/SrfK